MPTVAPRACAVDDRPSWLPRARSFSHAQEARARAAAACKSTDDRRRVRWARPGIEPPPPHTTPGPTRASTRRLLGPATRRSPSLASLTGRRSLVRSTADSLMAVGHGATPQGPLDRRHLARRHRHARAPLGPRPARSTPSRRAWRLDLTTSARRPDLCRPLQASVMPRSQGCARCVSRTLSVSNVLSCSCLL